MAILSNDDYIASARQSSVWVKTTTRTTVAGGWFSMFDIAGQPGAGTLAGSSTAAGVVPVDTTNGYPTINAFGGSATGYLSRVSYSSTVVSTVRLYDRVWNAGAYSFNANTAVTSPSWSSRVPGGTDYTSLEIWVEQVTAATGNQAVNVTYTNADGVASRTTGAVGIAAAPTVGRCWQLPLQAGDNGVQAISNVAGTVATAGTFNVMVLRRLWEGAVYVAGIGGTHSYIETGLPQVFADSALYALVNAPSGTSSGLPSLFFEIADK